MNAILTRGTARPFDLLHREMNRLLDDALAPADGRADGRQPFWSPRADVSETDDLYTLELDLPGVDAESLDVTMEDGILKISGERAVVRDESTTRIHRSERFHGRFFRSFALGTDVQADAVEADLADGVLRVTVPKAEAAQPRRIAVRHRANAEITMDAESLASN